MTAPLLDEDRLAAMLTAAAEPVTADPDLLARARRGGMRRRSRRRAGWGLAAAAAAAAVVMVGARVVAVPAPIPPAVAPSVPPSLEPAPPTVPVVPTLAGDPVPAALQGTWWHQQHHVEGWVPEVLNLTADSYSLPGSKTTGRAVMRGADLVLYGDTSCIADLGLAGASVYQVTLSQGTLTLTERDVAHDQCYRQTITSTKEHPSTPFTRVDEQHRPMRPSPPA